MTIPLTDVQLRRIIVTLRKFEKDLRLAQRILAGQEDQGIFYTEVISLSELYRVIAQQLIQEALENLTSLKNELGIPTEIDNLAHTLRANFHQNWVDLSAVRFKFDNIAFPDETVWLNKYDQAVQQLENASFQLGNIFNLGK